MVQAGKSGLTFEPSDLFSSSTMQNDSFDMKQLRILSFAPMIKVA